MKRIIYLDTNIYLDYLYDRISDISGRKLGDCSSNIFSKIISCQYHLAVSNWNLRELRNNCDGSETAMMFALLKKKIIKVHATEEDWKNARELSSENADDALHAILAKKSGAEAIVTRNLRHLNDFSDLIKPKLPEQI